jgi:general secretion pathway protein D
MNWNPSRAFVTSSLLLFSPLLLWAQTATSSTTTTTTTTTPSASSADSPTSAATAPADATVPANTNTATAPASTTPPPVDTTAATANTATAPTSTATPAVDTTTPPLSTITAPVSTAESAHQEIARRHVMAVSARQSVIDGEKLLSVGHYDDAAERFQYALDAVTPGGDSGRLYSRAETGLAAAKAGQSRALAANGKFAQAASLLQEAIALQPNDPTYTKDLDDLKQQQIVYEEQVHNPEGTDNNPAITEDFKDKVATVQKLLFQGQRYFETGQYERAENTFAKILILDPYNKAARDAMAHMERYRYSAANLRREEYKDEAMLTVNQEWSEAISPDIVVPPTTAVQVTEPSRRAEITGKLASIVIDKINFDKLDVASVVQFLTEKSKDLDPDHVGINFVLNLNTENTAAANNAAPTSATPSGAVPATTSTPASGTTTPGATTPGGAAPTEAPPGPIHRLVSIQLENVPLSDVLGYIIQQTNLQYSVDNYAVYLRPSIDEGQTLTVRTFLAPPGFFTSSGGLRVNQGSTPDQATTVTDVSDDVTQELKNRGIHFPPGATAVFLPGSSKLVVRNTPEQLDLVSNLIEQLSKESPQVQIEAKIAEFTENALRALSFNYILGFHDLIDGTVGSGGFQATTQLRDSNYTNSGVPTAGLQPDSIDNLIQQNTSSNVGLSPTFYTATGLTIQPNTPNIFTVGAVIDGIGFAAVINALKNNTGVDLISSPTVTTQNNLKANIDIVREFPYPTSFEKPKLSNTEVAYSSGIDGPQVFVVPGIPPAAPTVIQIQAPPLELAIPPTPREFVTQDIGVSLEVKPTTYPDQRIDLDITKAQVVDFDGFIDYGAPILTKLAFETPVTVLTPGTINQPVFNIRSMVTRLQILDGQTAVLGGLLREDTQEINDKVPVLGDLPLVGRLFQSKVSSRVKKNLLIFITAKLIKSNGKPEYVRTLNAEPEVEEKLPEPESTSPGTPLPPLPAEEPNS